MSYEPLDSCPIFQVDQACTSFGLSELLLSLNIIVRFDRLVVIFMT